MFRDATPLRHDPAALLARLREDGYLFFPGLIDPARVLAVRADVTTVLSKHGWLAEGTDPMDARPATKVRTFGEDNWWAGYTGILSQESFNRLAHEPALFGVMRSILGDETFAQPMKIARVTWPSSDYPTPPHQDFFFVRGTTDVLTSWVPLGDCPTELGGLKMLRGSHLEGLRGVEAARGAGGITAQVDADDPRWIGPIDYQAGDVLIFHSLTVHTAPSNQGDRLRLSADFRFQSAADPLVGGALSPHACGEGVPPWWALSNDWESTEWIDLAYPVRIAPARIDPNAVPTSRLLHPAGSP
jgi:hypothetical protein